MLPCTLAHTYLPSFLLLPAHTSGSIICPFFFLFPSLSSDVSFTTDQRPQSCMFFWLIYQLYISIFTNIAVRSNHSESYYDFFLHLQLDLLLCSNHPSIPSFVC